MVLSKLFKKVFLTESAQEFPKTVALVGGSFKPPHAGHWYMVEQYAKKADEVVILISDPKSAKSIRKTSAGTVITAQMAKEIFDIYIKRYNLTNKVKAIVSAEPSPITALFKYVDDNLSDVNVIFGVSKKDDDLKRFKSAQKYYEENEHIHLIDPAETAVEPYVDKHGNNISATDVRNNIENPEVIKKYLPKKLTPEDVQKVLQVLEVKPTTESEEVSKDNLEPCDETEQVHFNITDDMLAQAKISAYNVGLQAKDHKGKDIPVNPKKFPEKAIDIVFPVKQLLVEVYLDTKTKKWDSAVNYNGNIVKLSPDQMGEFFMSKFYGKMMAKLQHEWPLTDELYGGLYEGVANKEMQIDRVPVVEEGADDEKKDKETHSATGRKYMNFGDIGVRSKTARFTCWPKKGKEFSWSTWKDWKKIKPLCRMRFSYSNGHEYGVTISPIGENYANRGFRSYDLTEQPPLQWLSKEENADLMKLSLFNKFIRFCIKRIQKYVEMDPNEIYKKINNPEKIEVKDIVKTQTVIRKTLNNIIKKKQTDGFKWS